MAVWYNICMDETTCSVTDCNRPRHERGLCLMHYTRLRRHGDVNINLRPELSQTEEERFWSKVEKTESCWIWTGYKDKLGYGRFGKDRPYRFAYTLLVGPIPPGLSLDHLCRNPSCVNPAHLEPVTHRTNVLRGINPMAQEARQMHCKRGHEFTPENTRLYRGHRYCRACDRERTISRRKQG